MGGEGEEESGWAEVGFLLRLGAYLDRVWTSRECPTRHDRGTRIVRRTSLAWTERLELRLLQVAEREKLLNTAQRESLASKSMLYDRKNQIRDAHSTYVRTV